MANFLLRELLSQASTRAGRSTALKPLGWLLSILLSAALGVVGLSGPSWFVLVTVGFAAATTAAYLAAYVYLLLKNPDALRSETYVIQKLAIEKGLVGDSVTGLFELGGKPIKMQGLLVPGDEEIR